MPAFQHFILMRFNVKFSRKSQTRETELISRKGWLDERMVLFRDYCLPSLLAQTNQNFRTLIYFDSKTPAPYLNAISEMTGASDRFGIKLCDLYGSDILKHDLSEETSGGPPWLVTTRLDNDDGLNRNFVDWLQREVRIGKTEVLNFPMGLVYRSGRVYLSRQDSNAFISLSEPADSFRTVVAGPHKQMADVAPIRNIEGPVAWLQLIHDVNVSNKVRGTRIARTAIPEGFETIRGIEQGGPRESGLGIVAENVTVGALRGARDFCAGAVHSLRRLGSDRI